MPPQRQPPLPPGRQFAPRNAQCVRQSRSGDRFGSKGAYVSTSFPALPPLGSCLTQQAISQGVTRSQSLRNDTFETHSAYRDPSIAFRQTGLKSSHERSPYAGRENLSEPAPPSFAAILAIPWLPFAAGECAMESKQFARSSRLAKQNGERAAMQHHTSSAAASQKSECGHIKCDMGHPPGCHIGLAICSCRGVSTIHDRFRRRGKWFDFQAKNLIFSGPDRDRKRRGSLRDFEVECYRLGGHRSRSATSSRFEQGADLSAEPICPRGRRMASATRTGVGNALARGVSCRNGLLPAMSCINRILTALPMWVDVRSYYGHSISLPIGG